MDPMDVDSDLNKMDHQPPETNPYKIVFDDIVDDILFDICLEVHKSVKLDYFLPDEYYIKDGEFELWPQDTEKGENIIEKQLNLPSALHKKCSFVCCHCGEKKGPKNYTIHLDGCMNGVSRGSKRSKLVEIVESDKKPTKKATETVSFENLKTPEEKKAFFMKYCCAISKKGLYCKRSKQCHQHTNEERKAGRMPYKELLLEDTVV